MDKKEIHLYMNKNGHNKFYSMYINEDTNNWTAYWGKRGTRGQSMEYPMEKWYSKYWEKLDKGYEEVPETMGLVTYEQHKGDR